MSDPAADGDDDLIAGVWADVVRYPTMLGGTLAGQMIGIAIDAGIGTHTLWIPLACSVLLESIAGARFAGPAGGWVREPSACVRVSVTYSLALVAVSIPLFVWVVASNGNQGGGVSPLDQLTPARVGIMLVALVLATAARAGLMVGIGEGPPAMMATLLGALRLAFGAIARNKMRAALTVLGIFIGITAVVIVAAASTSAKDSITGAIDSVAANALYVSSQPAQASGVRVKSAGRLTEADGRAIAREAVSVSAVAPWLSTVGQVVYADKNWSTTVIGTNLSFFPIRRYTIATGALWTDHDEVFKTKVCVIGKTVASNLFGNADPVGRIVRVGRAPYTVIGVLSPRGTSFFGDDQDDMLMMPIGSFRARVVHTSPGRADQLLVSATSDQTTARAKVQIEGIMRQRHRVERGREDFVVNSAAELREKTDGILQDFSMLALGIALVSLLVGGIGVMNIMLVSVAERTREIGIRMSIGAREGDIMVQFLIEAIALTMIGGILGIVVGSAITIGVGQAMSSPMVPSPEALLLAVATSVVIGTVFGFLPAWRAAKLDPMSALRVE